MDSNGENRKKAAKLENVQNVTAVLYRDNYVIGAYSTDGSGTRIDFKNTRKIGVSD